MEKRISIPAKNVQQMATDCHKLHHKFVFIFSPFVLCCCFFSFVFCYYSFFWHIFQRSFKDFQVSAMCLSPLLHCRKYIMCISKKKYRTQNKIPLVIEEIPKRMNIFFLLFGMWTQKSIYTTCPFNKVYIYFFFVRFVSFVFFYFAHVSFIFISLL